MSWCQQPPQCQRSAWLRVYLHRKIQSLETYYVLNATTMASGYAERDPLGVTAMKMVK